MIHLDSLIFSRCGRTFARAREQNVIGHLAGKRTFFLRLSGAKSTFAVAPLLICPLAPVADKSTASSRLCLLKKRITSVSNFAILNARRAAINSFPSISRQRETRETHFVTPEPELTPSFDAMINAIKQKKKKRKTLAKATQFLALHGNRIHHCRSVCIIPCSLRLSIKRTPLVHKSWRVRRRYADKIGIEFPDVQSTYIRRTGSNFYFRSGE